MKREQIALAEIIFAGYEQLIDNPARNLHKWLNFGTFGSCKMCKLNQVNDGRDFEKCKECVFYPCRENTYDEFFKSIKHIENEIEYNPFGGYGNLVFAAKQRLEYLKRILRKNTE